MRSTEGTSSKFSAAELVAIRVRVRVFLSLGLLLEQRPNRVRERDRREPWSGPSKVSNSISGLTRLFVFEMTVVPLYLL